MANAKKNTFWTQMNEVFVLKFAGIFAGRLLHNCEWLDGQTASV